MKQSRIVIKLLTSCYKKVKSRHFSLMYATITFALVWYNGPVVQGLKVTKALASSDL